MQNDLSYEEIAEIALPIVKKYISKPHSIIFSTLEDILKVNGGVLDFESTSEIHYLFEIACTTFRNHIIEGRDEVNNANGINHTKEMYNFTKDVVLECSKKLNVNVNNIIDKRKGFYGYLDKELKRTNAISNIDEEKHILHFENSEEYLDFLDNPKLRLKKLENFPSEEITTQIHTRSDTSPTKVAGSNTIGNFVIEETYGLFDGLDSLTKDECLRLYELIQNYDYLTGQMKKIHYINNIIHKIEQKARLSKFSPEFKQDCLTLLSTLDKNDRYHGTVSSSIDSIIKNGLFMVQENLDNTSYPMQRFLSFNDKQALIEDLLLFRTGYDKMRGESMVFFKKNAKVIELTQEEIDSVKIDFSMTGAIDIQYKIDPKDIIGTIDTKKQIVTFGKSFKPKQERNF